MPSTRKPAYASFERSRPAGNDNVGALRLNHVHGTLDDLSAAVLHHDVTIHERLGDDRRHTHGRRLTVETLRQLDVGQSEGVEHRLQAGGVDRDSRRHLRRRHETRARIAVRYPSRRAHANTRGCAGIGCRRVRNRLRRRSERFDGAEDRFRTQAARLQTAESFRVERHTRELLDAEEIEKRFGGGLHGRQREREADDGDRRRCGEPSTHAGRRRDARDGVWREGTQRRAQSRLRRADPAAFSGHGEIGHP